MLRFVFSLFLFSIVQSRNVEHCAKRWILNDGNTMPPIAFGTFGRTDEFEDLGRALEWAIDAGYRHVDTSYSYFNEGVVGISINNVIRRGIVTREDLFITTKLDFYSNRDVVVPALRKSLKLLQMDYVDLYLIHFVNDMVTGQVIDYLDVWKGMEDAKRLGLARSIGVSNFNSSHINDIFVNSQIPPAVNQIEINPTFTNLELDAYCQSQGIRVMSYTPFGYLVPRPWQDVPQSAPGLDHPILIKIATKYNKRSSEIVIRYLIDRGTTPIPKSTNKEHIISNINVFDFSLTKEEVYLINQLDLNTPVYYKLEESDFFMYFFRTNKTEAQKSLSSDLMARTTDFEKQLEGKAVPSVDAVSRLSDEFHHFKKHVWDILSLLQQLIEVKTNPES